MALNPFLQYICTVPRYILCNLLGFANFTGLRAPKTLRKTVLFPFSADLRLNPEGESAYKMGSL